MEILFWAIAVVVCSTMTLINHRAKYKEQEDAIKNGHIVYKGWYE